MSRGRGLSLPILKGPLKGKRWLVATRINFFLGTYEVEQTEAFVKTVVENDVVYDCGAHYGYYTLLASTLAKNGKVFAFEPSPANLVRLHDHLEMNRCANVTVLESALGDRVGTAQFDNRTGSGVGHLAEDGPLQVPITTLDTLAAQLPPPNIMKIDVEGAEMQLLNGGKNLISAHKPAIFLSVHSDELRKQCSAFLEALAYSLQPLERGDFLAKVRPT